MNKVFDFLEINRMKINFDQRHMVGGWQWENQKSKIFNDKKKSIKIISKDYYTL